MARNIKEIRELTERLEALQPGDQAAVLRKVLTPQMELRLLAEDLRRKTARHDPRRIALDVNRTVREVRHSRRASR